MAYLPVLAAVIAVLGILITFKKNVDTLKEQPELIESCQTKLYIGAAISEAIPIILIVIGFVQMDTVASISELYVPFTIVFGLILLSIIYVLLQSRLDVDENSRGIVLQFGIITLGLSLAVPIIAIVMLSMMVP